MVSRIRGPRVAQTVEKRVRLKCHLSVPGVLKRSLRLPAVLQNQQVSPTSPDSGAKGRRFESCQAYHAFKDLVGIGSAREYPVAPKLPRASVPEQNAFDIPRLLPLRRNHRMGVTFIVVWMSEWRSNSSWTASGAPSSCRSVE